MVSHRTWLDRIRPTHQEGNFQTALVERTLASSETLAGCRIQVRCKETMWAIFRLEIVLSAIVATKKDDRVVVNLKSFQKSSDLTELSIHHMQERSIDPGISLSPLASRPRLILEKLPRWIIFIDSP